VYKVINKYLNPKYAIDILRRPEITLKSINRCHFQFHYNFTIVKSPNDLIALQLQHYPRSIGQSF